MAKDTLVSGKIDEKLIEWYKNLHRGAINNNASVCDDDDDIPLRKTKDYEC